MDKAEEAARKIVGENIDGNKYHDAKIRLIAAALRQARDEGAKEEREKVIKAGGIIAEQVYNKGRNEGLEESARKAEVGRLKGELDGNQAKLDDSQIECGKAQDDRDHWKALALKAREALELLCYSIMGTEGTKTNFEAPEWYRNRIKEANQLLSAFPAEENK